MSNPADSTSGSPTGTREHGPGTRKPSEVQAPLPKNSNIAHTKARTECISLTRNHISSVWPDLTGLRRRGVYPVRDPSEQLERSRIEAAEARARAEHLAAELERQREELIRVRSEARAASRLKSEFVANVSHELRTPLNGILGMTTLAMETELSGPQAEYLQMIHTSANSLLTIVNDILDFSKIETGSLELERIAFDLRETVVDILRPLSNLAHDKSLELICEIDPDVPRDVIGDPSRLRKILVNLVHNSIKFTETGEVIVRVRVQHVGVHDTTLRFEVVDTGIGIAPERQRWIFESFAQIDGSSTRKQGGTGLGLAISGQLAGLMGGEIHVASEPGRGSTFSFVVSFPVVEGRTEVHQLVPSESLHGLRALVADDNGTCCRVIVDSLKLAGLEPHSVTDGRAAWEALVRAREAGTPYAVAILDVHMPEIDGFALASRLLDDNEHRETAVILLTLAGHRGEGARCREIGVSAYHTKPFMTADLVESIRAVMGERNGSEARQLVTRHSLRESRAADTGASVQSMSAGRDAVVDGTSLVRRLSGDVDLLEEVTRIFGGERQEVLARLATAIRSRDENALERGALQLGSTLSSLSAATAADVAKRLAAMRLEGDLGEVELVFQELESKVAQVERELVALVQSGPSLAVLAQRTNDGERR